MAAAGRATLSLTTETNAIVDLLCERFRIHERMDAAKLGVSYGVRAGIIPSTHDRAPGSGTGSTWNIGSFDPGGELRGLVEALYPDVTGDPYVLAEALMNRGLVTLNEAIARYRPATLAGLVNLPRLADEGQLD